MNILKDNTMKEEFSVGQTIYFIENNSCVRPAIIISRGSGLYTIKFTDTSTVSGTRVRKNRLFVSKEEAETTLYNQGRNK